MSEVKEESRTRRSLWIRRLQRALMLLAIFAIAIYVVRYRSIAVSTLHRLEYAAILYAALTMCALHFFIVLSFQALHVALGIDRRIGRAFSSYYARLAARFLPGGIWHSVMRYSDMNLERAASGTGVGLVFVAESCTLATSGLVAAGILGLMQTGGSSLQPLFSEIMLTLGAMLGAGFAFLWHKRFGPKKWPLIATAFCGMVMVWIGAGVAFALLTTSGTEPMLANCSASPVAAAYVGASSLGYIAVFAPQGWGVTEFVFTVLRPCEAAPAAMVTAVVSFRIVSLGCDAICFLLYYAFFYFQKFFSSKRAA